MSRKKNSGVIGTILKAIGMLYLYLFKLIFLMFKGICIGIKKLTEHLSKLSPDEKHKLITYFQWIFSVMCIFVGTCLTIGENLLFIFMAIFGLLINPKFNDIYVRITKKDPLKKTPRIIASVVSFLMIYVAMGVYGLTNNNDKVSTADSKQVFTEITTVSTSATTTITELTTTEPAVTTTKKVTTTTKETTQEVTKEETLYPIVDDETPYREIYDYFMNLLDDESNPENEPTPTDPEELKNWMETFSQRLEQYEDECQNATAEKYGITYEDVENIWLYFTGNGRGFIDLGSIKPNNLNNKEKITTIETTQATTITTTSTTTEKETEPPQIVETAPFTNSYVLNTNTMKFHKQSCRDVKKISPENYDTFDGSRDEVINMGYDPCGHCNP